MSYFVFFSYRMEGKAIIMILTQRVIMMDLFQNITYSDGQNYKNKLFFSLLSIFSLYMEVILLFAIIRF